MSARDQYVNRCLDELHGGWAGAYVISGAVGAWRAERRDGTGMLLAHDPGELWERIRRDYQRHLVPK